MPICFVLLRVFNLSCLQIRFLFIHFLHCVLIVVCESKIKRMWKHLFPFPFALPPLPVERTPLICIYLFIYLSIYLFIYLRTRLLQILNINSGESLCVPWLNLTTLILSIHPECCAARNVVTMVLAEVATVITPLDVVARSWEEFKPV